MRFVVLLAAIIVGLSTLLLIWYMQNGYRTLAIGHYRYRLQVVSNSAARAKGLGGRTSLPANQGMLFVYPQQQTLCFWMKDMRFSVDMIWTDAQQQVTHIAADIAPQTYPKQFCAPGEYVIELRAGQVQANGLSTGQYLQL